MKTIKNCVGLAFLAALVMSYNTNLKARDGMGCDEPTTSQDGIMCVYTYACYFDATPSNGWDDPSGDPFNTDYDFCNLQYYPPAGTIQYRIDQFCNYLGYSVGDLAPIISGMTPSDHSPYWSDGQLCYDGSFTCWISLEQTCPS
jgi:hypothetical protein